jgi:hypothetical protein
MMERYRTGLGLLVVMVATACTDPATDDDASGGTASGAGGHSGASTSAGSTTSSGGSSSSTGSASSATGSSSGTGGSAGDACPPFPEFPDEQCTGYEHTGVTLHTDGCPTKITTANATYDGCLFTDSIEVLAENVTITRSKVQGDVSPALGSEPYAGDLRGLTLIDVEIDGLDQAVDDSGIFGLNFSCLRCNIHGVGSPIRTVSNVKVTDSYLHDNSYGGASHNSGMSMRGDNIEVTHNNIRCDASWNCSGAFQIYAKDTDSGHIDNVLAQHNLFYSETGYCIYGGWTYDNGSLIGQASNVRILDNAFLSSAQWPDKVCGDIGASGGWPAPDQAAAAGDQWSGNYQYPNASATVDP